jgi:hypothetical protein
MANAFCALRAWVLVFFTPASAPPEHAGPGNGDRPTVSRRKPAGVDFRGLSNGQ